MFQVAKPVKNMALNTCSKTPQEDRATENTEQHHAGMVLEDAVNGASISISFHVQDPEFPRLQEVRQAVAAT